MRRPTLRGLELTNTRPVASVSDSERTNGSGRMAASSSSAVGVAGVGSVARVRAVSSTTCSVWVRASSNAVACNATVWWARSSASRRWVHNT